MQSTSAQLGRYEIQRTIGRGSQGRVYLARDPKLQRDVAIKVLTTDKAEFKLTDENGTPLEALTASRVKHANIIPIHDIGDSEHGPFLVFGFVEGKTLALELSKHQRYELADAIPMMATILDAMKSAHSAGVLHLDLSPRNIMINSDGAPQIMDFGLSQFVDFRRTDLTLATGTLRYMAPEHFLRQQLGPFTDVFALGSTFYEMLVGERAIQGGSVEDMQRAIANGDIDLDKLNQLPHAEDLQRFFKGAFAVEPTTRYADAGVMFKAFQTMITAVGLGDALRSDEGGHSTVDFLIRRMQRKKDFPAISSTLTEINRLTSDENVAPADALANVILRDMSLTSKLLKMANSGFYGVRAAEVTSISQAVVLLGIPQVRMISSSLILFGNMKSDSSILKDSMTRSFFAGLLARHLAKREQLRNDEEAFIAGMCQNLGENLVIYYFPEEHEDIEALRAQNGISKKAAATEILGVPYASLGAKVAEIWSLPSIIADAIRGLDDGPVPAPADDEEKARQIAILTNQLCDVFVAVSPDDATDTLDEVAARFESAITLDPIYVFNLFSAAFEKLEMFAPVFEINVGQSEFCGAVSAWLKRREPQVAQLIEAAEQATATG
ncbi:MAG: HDOD domain-containing protein [Pseudomonadota bacterium]